MQISHLSDISALHGVSHPINADTGQGGIHQSTMNQAFRRNALTHPSLASNPNMSEDQKLRVLCDDFEALFIHQMLKSMRNTIDKSSGLVDGGMGEEIFQDMLDAEYAQESARSRTLGISDMLYAQLTVNKGHIRGAGPAGPGQASGSYSQLSFEKVSGI